MAYGSTRATAPPYPLLVAFLAGAAAAAADGWSAPRGAATAPDEPRLLAVSPAATTAARVVTARVRRMGPPEIGGSAPPPLPVPAPLSTPTRRPRLSRSPLVPAQEAFHVRRPSYRPQGHRRRRRGRAVRRPGGGARRGAHTTPPAAALVPVPDKRDGAVRLHLPRGFNYRSFHDTEQPVVAHRRHQAARPARRHGCVRRARRHRACWSATTRSPTPDARPSAPGTPYDAMGRRRHHHHPGHQAGRADPVVHQPQRHDVQLLRRRRCPGARG